jgi:beta-galactosidase
MREAGVNRVSLGMFAWSTIEPQDGRFELDWLERLLDRLDAASIGVNLATPSAAPPWWLLDAHPEIQLVDAQGRRVPGGGRLSWCPSSAVFRHYATRAAAVLSEAFGRHPALSLWHVGNEFGNENAQCFCDECAIAFRSWARRRHTTLDTLNRAWGTAFWGHGYTAWSQITPPRTTRNPPDPGLALDYRRFCSDQLLAHYRAEVVAIRGAGSTVPATTNFMIAQGADAIDHHAWSAEVDVVANDHYTVAADPERHRELAFSADRARGVAGGGPWLLMEHSTSAVNWQPRNRAKGPGEMRRDTLSHIARGADGALFFQWRASTAGVEQFHSAMVPHAGVHTRVWREVCELGAELARLAPVTGSVVERAEVAVLWDAQAHWAMDAARPPTIDVAYPLLPERTHRAFHRRGIRVDVLHPDDALAGYRLIILPGLYQASAGLTERLDAAVRSGMHVLITALSGIVDDTARVIGGGYPGAFRELLGLRGEELLPLQPGQRVRLSDGSTAERWVEHLTPTTSRTTATFSDGPLRGLGAMTRRELGAGTVRYVAAVLAEESFDALAGALTAELGIRPPAAATGTAVDLVRRVAADGTGFLFCINHGAEEAEIAVYGEDLLTGRVARGTGAVPAGGAAVFRERRTSLSGGHHDERGQS